MLDDLIGLLHWALVLKQWDCTQNERERERVNFSVFSIYTRANNENKTTVYDSLRRSREDNVRTNSEHHALPC